VVQIHSPRPFYPIKQGLFRAVRRRRLSGEWRHSPFTLLFGKGFRSVADMSATCVSSTRGLKIAPSRPYERRCGACEAAQARRCSRCTDVAGQLPPSPAA
jgi:hypothetical protein